MTVIARCQSARKINVPHGPWLCLDCVSRLHSGHEVVTPICNRFGVLNWISPHSQETGWNAIPNSAAAQYGLSRSSLARERALEPDTLEQTHPAIQKVPGLMRSHSVDPACYDEIYGVHIHNERRAGSTIRSGAE